MRLTDEQLEKVKAKYNVEELWSFSRFDTFRISPYLFFLKYVKKEQPKKDIVSPYGIIGNAAHTILEKLYSGDIQYSEMADAFLNEYTTQIEIFGLKFNNTDEKMNDSISIKYKRDLEHFFRNYKPIDAKHQMEKFIATEVQPGVAVLQGYIDDVCKIDGKYIITDFKTSSKSGFIGEKLKEKAAQLAIYAKGLEQMGVPADSVVARFCMLKYVSVDIRQKNGKVKTSDIERCKIGERLQPKAAVWLKEFGYSKEEINNFLAQMFVDNSIDCLPDEVKECFTIRDCYIEIENPLDVYEEVKKEIIDVVSEVDNRMHEWEQTFDEKIWWDPEDLLEENSYYHVQISSYNINQHKPFYEWCQKQEEQKAASEDLLGVTAKEKEENDMSWLNDIA